MSELADGYLEAQRTKMVGLLIKRGATQEDAEDAVQRALVKVWQKNKLGDAAYLTRAVLNESRDIHRYHRRRPEVTEADLLDTDGKPPRRKQRASSRHLEDELTQSQTLDETLQALKRLTARDRSAIVQAATGGRKAYGTGSDSNAARSVLNRARKKLRDILAG